MPAEFYKSIVFLDIGRIMGHDIAVLPGNDAEVLPVAASLLKGDDLFGRMFTPLKKKLGNIVEDFRHWQIYKDAGKYKDAME